MFLWFSFVTLKIAQYAWIIAAFTVCIENFKQLMVSKQAVPIVARLGLDHILLLDTEPTVLQYDFSFLVL
jgi:hypothetical protein